LNNATCSLCPFGHACPRGASTPTICVKGEFALNGSAECSKCDLGQYSDKPAKNKCLHCPTGRYQDGKGEVGCKPCPIDTFGDRTGYTAKAQCTPCQIYTSTLGKEAQTLASKCFLQRWEISFLRWRGSQRMFVVPSWGHMQATE